MSDRNYVYLLRCADNTMYCGWTTDLKARLAAHNNGKGAKYTRSRLPVELIWFEEFEDRHDALSREWHIKRMSRETKMALVESAFRQENGAPGKSVVSKKGIGMKKLFIDTSLPEKWRKTSGMGIVLTRVGRLPC